MKQEYLWVTNENETNLVENESTLSIFGPTSLTFPEPPKPTCQGNKIKVIIGGLIKNFVLVSLGFFTFSFQLSNYNIKISNMVFLKKNNSCAHITNQKS
jgi:hypothetical protein